jgi:hypothetical protein
MIRKTFLTLAVVLFAVVTLMVIPVNAGEVSTQGPEQQSSQYTQEAQAFNHSDAVQYAQISWPFQKNQGEQSQQQSQEPQENNQSQSQGEQTQQYAQKQQPQNSNQGTQSQEEQSEQQQSSNQNDSQNNQESQKAS